MSEPDDKRPQYVAYVFAPTVTPETTDWLARNCPDVVDVVAAGEGMAVKMNPFTGEHGLVPASEAMGDDD